MKSLTFDRFLVLAVLMAFWSTTLIAQASRDPYTTLPIPIEVTSFPYYEEGFDSNATASGTPTGMQGTCSPLACCSGVWYKITLDTRGSLVSAVEDYTQLATGLIWYKAESENITTTDQLTYIAGIPNNFCGYAGFTSPSFGYQWRLKYDPDYSTGPGETQTQANMSTWSSSRLNDPFPTDLTQYPENGWRTDIELESGKHYLEPGTYWLYAWNSNQQSNLMGNSTRLIIDFIELCPEGFSCVNVSETICTSESYTTQNGQVITETSTVEETIGTNIITYNITVDESITCCPDGYTCNEVDLTECSSSIYTTPFGNTISETGSVLDEDTEAKTRTVYNVTFDRAEVTTDVYSDGLIAASGLVSYTAQTNATGVLTFDKDQDFWVDMNALQDDLNGTSRSVFMWVKSEANVANDNQSLFAINTASGGNVALFLIDNEGDNLELYDGNNARSASFNMSDQLWHYVGYTYDASTNETVIYVDGIENQRFTNDQSTLANSKYSLGQEFDNANDTDHFNGDMAEISVWDEVLTAAEVREAMRAKINNGHPKYTNLVGYYSIFGDCDDPTDVLKDHSGKGNDGVMVNSFTLDFKNVKAIPGFNSLDWYENMSWKKDGAEVSTDPTYTFDLAPGDFEFVATRSFIKSSDVWTLTANSNATEVDNLVDETLCEDDPVTRTVTDVNAVNYLDFEEDEANYIEVNSLAAPLAGQSRSVFMWVNKESNVANGDVDQLFSIMSDDGFNAITNLYINASEKVTLYDGNNTYASSTTIANDTWYYVGYTYDASTFESKIYINGVEEKTFTKEMPVSAGNLISLGQRYEENGTGGYLDGKLAEITVWDKVLSEEEVNSLMAAAPAYNTVNLVASYGTFKNIADNRLLDLTNNGNDGLASHNTILVTTEEAELTDYDASVHYSYSWKKDGTEFDTDASANIIIDEGTTNYSVTYGTPFFQKTDAFALSYTNLLPTQPVSQTTGVTSAVTFEVDEIPGASYQWYKREQSTATLQFGSDGFPDISRINDITADGDHIFIGTSGDGIVMSSDGGQTWKIVDNYAIEFTTATVFDIEIYGDTILAGTNKGLAISQDKGLNWERINSYEGTGSRGSMSSVQMYDGVIYGVLNDKAIKSADLGQNWVTLGASSPSSFKNIFVDGQSIILTSNDATVNGSPAEGGIYVSNDGGQTFTSSRVSEAEYGSGDQDFNDAIIIGSTYFVGTPKGLYKSIDAVNWVNVNDFRGAADNLQVDGTVFYLTVGAALNKSADNGISWEFDRAAGFITSVDSGGFYYSNGSSSSGFTLTTDFASLENNSDNTATNQIQGATTHQLTINNLSLDENAAEYFVEVTLGECTQTSDDVTLTVLDVPVVSTFSPDNGSTDVPIDTDFTITYNKNISAGAGSLRIFNADDDSEVQALAVSTATVDGQNITFSLSSDLAYASDFYIKLDADLVQDENSNESLAIEDITYWTFTTVCEPLILTQPEDQTGFVGGSATFSVPEVSGASYQWFQNGEETWTTYSESSGNGFPHDRARTVHVSDGVIYAGTSNGLAILEEGASSWNVIQAGDNNFPDNEVFYVYESDGTIYAGTNDGGLAVLEDDASSWTVYQQGNGPGDITSNSIRSIVKENDDLYVGTNGGGLVILRSGETDWEVIDINNSNLPNNTVYSLVVKDGTIYAGTLGGGLAILEEGESTWQVYQQGDNNFPNNEVTSLFVNDNTIYAGTQGGLAVLESGANDWTVYTQGNNDFPADDVYAVHVANGDIYVGTASGGLGILKRGETTWEVKNTANSDLPDNRVFAIKEYRSKIYLGTFGGGLAIYEDDVFLLSNPDNSADNQIIGADTRELTINNLTEDFDQTEYFVVVTKGDCEETSETVRLTIDPCPPLINMQPTDQQGLEGTDVAFSIPEVAGASYQWYQSVENFSTVDSNNGLGNNTTRSVYVEGDNIYVGTVAGISISTNGGDSYTNYDTEDGLISNEVNSVFSDGNNIYVGTSAGLSISDDGGQNWSNFTNNNGLGANLVREVFKSGESLYVATFGGGLSVTTDNGQNWTVIRSTDGLITNNIDAVYADGDNIYAGSSIGLSISNDGGQSWSNYNQVDGLSNSKINSLYVREGIIYAGTGSGLSVSEDNGSNWTNFFIQDGLASNDIRSVFVTETHIYLGHNGQGLSVSSDNGANWRNITGGQGLVGSFIRDIYESHGNVYVATNDASVGLTTIETRIALTNNADDTAENQIQGATTQELAINNITSEIDQTEYFVVVTKGDCVETSNTATLSISEPLSPLEISNSDPSATRDARIDFANFRLFFDEAVEMGAGTLTIFRASDNSVFESLDVS